MNVTLVQIAKSKRVIMEAYQKNSLFYIFN